MVRDHTAAFYHPLLTPPPDYWEVVGGDMKKPPLPPKSERRKSSYGGTYQVLTAIPPLPPAPPRYFPLRPYETPVKPIPRLPPSNPDSFSMSPLEPTKSRSVSSPTVLPASPTLSIASLSSNASSNGSTPSISPSTPARYRHRRTSSSTTNESPGAHQALNSFPSTSTLSSCGRPRGLRHMRSPPKEGLRSLRAKESEACLKAAYDRQLNAYLDGSIALGAFGLEGIEE